MNPTPTQRELMGQIIQKTRIIDSIRRNPIRDYGKAAALAKLMKDRADLQRQLNGLRIVGGTDTIQKDTDDQSQRTDAG
jgi:hypothetical protein